MIKFIKKILPFSLLFLIISFTSIYATWKSISDFYDPVVSWDIITSAWYNAVNTLKANLKSPNFTGIPTAPMPNAWDSSQQIATTARVSTNAGVSSATSSGWILNWDNMYSSNTGYVWINKNNPTSSLHIAAKPYPDFNPSFWWIRVDATDINTSPWITFELADVTGVSMASMWSASWNGAFTNDSNTNDFVMRWNLTWDVRLATFKAPWIIDTGILLKNNWNVWIGTNDPTANLEIKTSDKQKISFKNHPDSSGVAGWSMTIHTDSTSERSWLQLSSSSGPSSPNITSGYLAVYWKDTGGPNQQNMVLGLNNWGGGAGDIKGLLVRSWIGTLAYFDGYNGNVGIGVSTPLSKLDVNGKIKMREQTVTSDSADTVATKWYVDSKSGWWSTFSCEYKCPKDCAPTAYNAGEVWVISENECVIILGSSITKKNITAWDDCWVIAWGGWCSGNKYICTTSGRIGWSYDNCK